jgi:hypothetical protein
MYIASRNVTQRHRRRIDEPNKVTAEIDTLKRFCFGANVTFEPA